MMQRETWVHFKEVLKKVEHKVIGRCAVCAHFTYYILTVVEAHGPWKSIMVTVGVVLAVEHAIKLTGGTNHE